MNRELFGSLHEANIILEQWREEYNEQRPHSALGYRTPQEYANLCNPRFRSGNALSATGIANQRINYKSTNPAGLQF